MSARQVCIEVDDIALHGLLRRPQSATGLVLFAHGSSSGHRSPRNNFVAERLAAAGIATLLFDLLSESEERIDARDAALRFDIPLLSARLRLATQWARAHEELSALRLGYFGASTGAPPARAPAAPAPDNRAKDARGGRPDLAGAALARVRAPTLLIVGGEDHPVLALNRQARGQLSCPSELAVIPAATHLFEEPGALEQVAALAAGWFARHLGSTRTAHRASSPLPR